MDSKEIHVGFVGGFNMAGNVLTLLKNVRRVLEEQRTKFHCDLICSPPEDAPAGFRAVEMEATPPHTARNRILTLSRELRQYANRENPDILFQVTLFPTHGTAAAIAGQLTGTPTITRLAGEDFCEYKFAKGIAERGQLFLLKNVLSWIPVHVPDGVIALGPNGKKSISNRFRTENVWTIPQPIDRDHFSPVSRGVRADLRADLGMPSAENGTVLLTVGRVTQRKGAQTILHTAPSLPDETIWYVVGDGPMRSELAEVQGVRTVGRVPHDEVRQYYRAADLYVHPSLHDGLPNVLLEATACGTPSIARDVGECETIATETFDLDVELLKLLQRTYDRVELDDRFNEDRLGERYESVLSEVTQ